MKTPKLGVVQLSREDKSVCCVESIDTKLHFSATSMTVGKPT